jgi:chromosome segregation ATPase
MATDNPSDAERADDETQDPTPPRKVERAEPKKPAVARDEDLPDDPDELKEELKRAREALKRTNRENADRRRRTEELERAEEERKNATLGETDRLKKERAEADRRAAEAERRAADADAKLVRQRIDLEVERLAARMGFLYPDIAAQLIERGRVEIDEDSGKVVGVKEALERLVKERPGLVEASPRGGTPPREGPRRTAATGAREERGNPFEDDLRGSGKYSV